MKPVFCVKKAGALVSVTPLTAEPADLVFQLTGIDRETLPLDVSAHKIALKTIKALGDLVRKYRTSTETHRVVPRFWPSLRELFKGKIPDHVAKVCPPYSKKDAEIFTMRPLFKSRS